MIIIITKSEIRIITVILVIIIIIIIMIIKIARIMIKKQKQETLNKRTQSKRGDKKTFHCSANK